MVANAGFLLKYLVSLLLLSVANDPAVPADTMRPHTMSNSVFSDPHTSPHLHVVAA